jgi:hypothetical protein
MTLTQRPVIVAFLVFLTLSYAFGTSSVLAGDQRTLDISSTPGGSVTNPGEGTFQYDDGSEVTIAAVADLNYHFVGWAGSAVDAGKVADPNSASTTVTVDADYTLQANFAIDRRTLTVSSTAGGSVSVPGEGSFEYDHGAEVPITAAADLYYHFLGWTGTAVDADAVTDPNSSITTVRMDADYDLQAHFVVSDPIFFVSPTPDDGEAITDSAVDINIMIVEPNLTDVTFDWNGSGYTLYDDSLVLMFNFDNVSALGEDYSVPCGLVKDLSLAGNDGYLSDPICSSEKVPVWIPNGRYGGAFDFTGDGTTQGQSILVYHSDSLNPGSGDFAITFWILTRDDYDGDVIRKGSTYTAGTWYKVEHAPSGPTDYIYWELNTDGTDASVYSTDVYNDNKWHFVFAQRKNDPGGDVAELWIDGVLNETDPVSGSILNNANLAIGSKNTQDDDFINSSVDEVRIYMRSFSPAEIRQFYHSNLSKYDAHKWALYVNQSDLAEGTYTYQAFASDIEGQTNATEQRTLNVYMPQPPTVYLNSPSDGAVRNSTAVTFTCSASDPVGLLDAALYVGYSPQTVTFSGQNQTDDAEISADNPNSNYGGEYLSGINVDGSGPHCHAVIKFPDIVGMAPGQVPAGATIVSAVLKVHCFGDGNPTRLYRLTEDWAENSVTWNNRRDSLAWTNPGADGPGSHGGVAIEADFSQTGWRTIDITEFAQDWSDGLPNYGVVLVDTGSNGVDFDSSESANPPLLTIMYVSAWEQRGYVALSGTDATITFDPVSLADQHTYT